MVLLFDMSGDYWNLVGGCVWWMTAVEEHSGTHSQQRLEGFQSLIVWLFFWWLFLGNHWGGGGFFQNVLEPDVSEYETNYESHGIAMVFMKVVNSM
jgi:hypothetical protein